MLKKLLGGELLERIISLLIILAVFATLASLALVVLTNPPAKFYYAVLFNFALLGSLMHVKFILVEESEEYKILKKDLLELGISEREIDEYIKNRRHWDAYTKWVGFSVGLALIFIFVYLFIP